MDIAQIIKALSRWGMIYGMEINEEGNIYLTGEGIKV
jgi:hypothetical protein